MSETNTLNPGKLAYGLRNYQLYFSIPGFLKTDRLTRVYACQKKTPRNAKKRFKKTRKDALLFCIAKICVNTSVNQFLCFYAFFRVFLCLFII